MEAFALKEKLWTKKYLFSLLLVFGVNMGYALLNSVMAIYGSVLTSSSVAGGYMISVFTLSALVVRLGIKKLNEKYSNKTLLIFGLVLTVLAAAGYCWAKTLFPFLFFRMIHGFGFGISLTCATAISNQYVPASRLSEGVGFTSSANTVANAIGPTLALEILGQQYTHFLTLFLVLLGISLVTCILSLLITGAQKSNPSNGAKKTHQGIVIALVFVLATFSQSAVNSFLTSYTKTLDLGNIGFFFTITAVVTFISRFFSKKLQNGLGLKKMSLVLTLLMGLCILALTWLKTSRQLFFLAIPYGLSIGLLFPLFNYRIIQTVDASQFAYATSIYYCSLDFGYGIGAIIWGYISQYSGFQVMYLLAGALIGVMAVLDQLLLREKRG